MGVLALLAFYWVRVPVVFLPEAYPPIVILQVADTVGCIQPRALRVASSRRLHQAAGPIEVARIGCIWLIAILVLHIDLRDDVVLEEGARLVAVGGVAGTHDLQDQSIVTINSRMNLARPSQ